jgi:hypothetical protein
VLTKWPDFERVCWYIRCTEGPTRTILDYDFVEGNRRAFEPGDVLTAEYRIDSLSLVDAKAIEASVIWYTVGKGDEDLAVHHFVRQTTDAGVVFDLRRPQRLRATLPSSPLSYDGVIVKVRWCVRVRLFPESVSELVAEIP